MSAATRQWEDDTQTQTVTNTVTENLMAWPGSEFRTYWRPLVSVTSISYFDEDGNQQTLDPSQYSVDAPNRKIYPAYGVTWPTTQERWDAIEIIYEAGSTQVPDIARQAILMQCDVMEELRGTTREKDAAIKAYEMLVTRYMRGSYP